MLVLLDRRVQDRVHIAGSKVSAVVHDHLHAAPAIQKFACGRLGPGEVGQVHLQGVGLAPKRLDLLGRLLQTAGKGGVVFAMDRDGVVAYRIALAHGPGGDGHVVASSGQLNGDGLSDPATCSRNQRAFRSHPNPLAF